jgi:hypothetical protein
MELHGTLTVASGRKLIAYHHIYFLPQCVLFEASKCIMSQLREKVVQATGSDKHVYGLVYHIHNDSGIVHIAVVCTKSPGLSCSKQFGCFVFSSAPSVSSSIS